VPISLATLHGSPFTGGLRMMAVAERYSRPLLRYMCARCLDTGRGDKLVISQVGWALAGAATVTPDIMLTASAALLIAEFHCSSVQVLQSLN
jgi:hypothetical protein